MKKVFITLVFILTTIVSFSQSTDNTLKFLGHPVDGSKESMERHLRSRGFKYMDYTDSYQGKFNGKEVDVFISVNSRNLVDRIYVSFPKTNSESTIINEYNRLLEQFEENEKYVPLMEENSKIPTNEDISYEMSIKNKVYQSSFYSIPDSTVLKQEIQSSLTEEQFERLQQLKSEKISEEDLNIEDIQTIMTVLEITQKVITGNVWFTIHEKYGYYNIGLYYDNLKNRPNGEDL